MKKASKELSLWNAKIREGEIGETDEEWVGRGGAFYEAGGNKGIMKSEKVEGEVGTWRDRERDRER